MLLVRSVETDRFLFPLDSKRWSKVGRFIIVLFLFLFLEAFNAADPSGAQNACNTWAATMSGETGRPGMLYYFLIFSFNFHLSPPLQYIMVTHFLLAKCFFFFFTLSGKKRVFQVIYKRRITRSCSLCWMARCRPTTYGKRANFICHSL